MLNRERLIEFCDKKGIWVPSKKTSLKELTVLIARWALNNETVERKSCFGLLDIEDNNCLSCDFRNQCFKISMGTDEETYWKRLDKIDKPKIDF
jgi:hypothetical protein